MIIATTHGDPPKREHVWLHSLTGGFYRACNHRDRKPAEQLNTTDEGYVACRQSACQLLRNVATREIPADL